MRKIMTNYHVRLSHGGEATKEKKKERFKTMGPKKTSRHSKRVWQPSAWSFEPYDVENCHAIVHSKKVNMSRLEYARLFGATIIESVKRTASWASYYNTSRKSKHPRPDTKLSLDNVPLMIPLPAVNLPSNDCDILRNWTSAYGSVVRQRTVWKNVMAIIAIYTDCPFHWTNNTITIILGRLWFRKIIPLE